MDISIGSTTVTTLSLFSDSVDTYVACGSDGTEDSQCKNDNNFQAKTVTDLYGERLRQLESVAARGHVASSVYTGSVAMAAVLDWLITHRDRFWCWEELEIQKTALVTVTRGLIGWLIRASIGFWDFLSWRSRSAMITGLIQVGVHALCRNTCMSRSFIFRRNFCHRHRHFHDKERTPERLIADGESVSSQEAAVTVRIQHGRNLRI